MGLGKRKCTSTARLDGVTVVITGCNTGIGKLTAQDLYQRGARVIMACRNLTKAQEALNSIKTEKKKTNSTAGTLLITELNLQSLASVRACAEHILNTEPKIQLLINNAGIIACPEGLTEDGFEIQFGTNHVGHFLLTILLLPKMIASAPSRVVTVSSLLHAYGPQLKFDDLNYKRRSYSPMGGYQQSKLANVLFTKELAKRLENTGVTTYALHPGSILTDGQRHYDSAFFPGAVCITRTFGKLFTVSPEQGAQTTIYCAVSEQAGKETGLYYSNCKVTKPSAAARDEDAARRLWDLSWKFVGLTSDPYPLPENK